MNGKLAHHTIEEIIQILGEDFEDFLRRTDTKDIPPQSKPIEKVEDAYDRAMRGI